MNKFWHHMVVFDVNGKKITEATRKSEQAVSNWCNKMYRKYGDGIKIEEYDMNTMKLVCTWGA